MGSPLSERVMVGTAESGARSETVDCCFWSAGRAGGNCGGDDGMNPIEDEGIGVG
jgi:hypothetical protein